MATSTIKINKIKRFDLTTSLSGTLAAYGIYDPNSCSVRIYLYYGATTTVGVEDVLTTIPSQYRPSSETSLRAIGITTSGTITAGSGRVLANGTIQQRLSSNLKACSIFGEYSI